MTSGGRYGREGGRLRTHSGTPSLARLNYRLMTWGWDWTIWFKRTPGSCPSISIEILPTLIKSQRERGNVLDDYADPKTLTYDELRAQVLRQIETIDGQEDLDLLLKAERLRCAQAICTRCHDGDVPQPHQIGRDVYFFHIANGINANSICDAANIWKLKANHGPV